ncbi:MAG: hypothetical protein RIT45_4 [Pseudomonadota bacterium]
MSPPLGPRPVGLARVEGVSDAAHALVEDAEVVDLHLDSFISARLLGYDLNATHGLGWLQGRFFGHLDFPRALQGGLTAGMWSITTNPFRPAAARWRLFGENHRRLHEVVAASEGRLRIVRDVAGLRAARAEGAHAVLPSIQGANAVQAAPGGAAALPDDIWRVTLVHLTHAVYGPTSSPLGLGRRDQGLSAQGIELVRTLDARRVFVDLAHIGHRAFHDAVREHDASLPLLATHTGVSGVTPHWRNLDDDELRAIAATDGVVGIIFQAGFLRRKSGPRDVDMVVEHLDHVRRTIGARHAAIGTDYDGAIVPPGDLRDGRDGYLRLCDALLRAGWDDAEIRGVLGDNALRVFAAMRG